MPESHPFAQRLKASQERSTSSICLGLDPRPRQHGRNGETIASVAEDYKKLLDAVADDVAAVKPQSAFFEAYGLAGLTALSELLQHARALNLPVVLDAKRGDIGSTAEAYAAAYLQAGDFEADALTVNPFLGFDTLEPFVDQVAESNKGIYVLVATSNAGRADIQEASDQNIEPTRTVTETLAAWVRSTNERLGFPEGSYGPIGAVVGATTGQMLQTMREAMPNAPLLVPGYGTQGGSADEAAHAFDSDAGGALINASRSLLYPEGTFSIEASQRAIKAMKRALTEAT